MGPIRSKHSSYRYAPWNTGAPCHIESTDLSILCGLLGNEEANQPPLESPDTRALVHQRSTQYKFLPDPSITIQPSEALVRQPSLPRDVQEPNDSLRLGMRVIDSVHKMMFEVPHVHEVADILRRLTCKSNHASTSRETTRDPELNAIFHLSSLLHEFDQEMESEFPWLPKALHTLRQFSAQREHKEDPGQPALGGEDLLQIAVLREEVHNGETRVEDTRKGLESTSMMAGNLASYTMVGGVGDMDVAGENSLLGCEFESYSYSALYDLQPPPSQAGTPVLTNCNNPDIRSQNASSSYSRDGLLPLNLTTIPTPILQVDDDTVTQNRYAITCVAPGVPEAAFKLELDITLRPCIRLESSTQNSPL